MNFSHSFSIEGRPIGTGQSCYVIAEAGVAHFGDVDKAFRLVDLAVDAGADAVKFQIFNVDSMFSSEAADWKARMGSRCLSYDEFAKVKSYCLDIDITFFATAHDRPSFDYLVGLEVPVYKVGSGELRNWEYLETVASTGQPTIVSTGMYSNADVQKAVSVLETAGNPKIVLLHCVTSYPTRASDVNLNAMVFLRDEFNLLTGYSDHTVGYHVPLAAVALGATVIEKHISLDFNVPNAQDWKVSCGPHDLKRFINELREVEKSLGRLGKIPTKSESNNMRWALKSLVVTRNVRAGEIVDETMLAVKRPGTGISPDQIENILGKRFVNDKHVDAVVNWDDLE